MKRWRLRDSHKLVDSTLGGPIRWKEPSLLWYSSLAGKPTWRTHQIQRACPNPSYHVTSFGFIRPHILSWYQLMNWFAPLSGPHSLLSKNTSFVKTGPFLIFFSVRLINPGQYRLHSRCSAKTCSWLESGSGVTAKTMVKSGARAVSFRCRCYTLWSLHQHSPPSLGRRTPKGSDTSKEPRPHLRRVNSRQAGSMSSGSSLSSLQSTRASEILVLIKYMWDKRMNDQVTKPAGNLCQNHPG